MPGTVTAIAEWAAAIIELLGLAVITALGVYSLAFALYRLATGTDGTTVFRETRLRLIRGILLGLEFLVAADIIHTVAVELTFTSVGVLASIVLIRTFLSVALELEMNGRWPWQKPERT